MKKTALITGASSGIGREFARLFAREGYDLVLVARSEGKLRQLSEEAQALGAAVTVIPMDLTRENAARVLKEELTGRGVEIDVLVNNAGFGDAAPFLDENWDRAKRLIDLNMTALAQLCYEFGRGMRERRAGKIINIASIAAYCPGPFMALYYASKSFVLSFSQAIYEELKPFSVTVTAVCLGPARTGFEKEAGLEKSRMFTFFRPAKPEEVALTAYRAAMKGKAVAYHGAISRVVDLLTRLGPRSAARKCTMWINELRN